MMDELCVTFPVGLLNTENGYYLPIIYNFTPLTKTKLRNKQDQLGTGRETAQCAGQADEQEGPDHSPTRGADDNTCDH